MSITESIYDAMLELHKYKIQPTGIVLGPLQFLQIEKDTADMLKFCESAGIRHDFTLEEGKLFGMSILLGNCDGFCFVMNKDDHFRLASSLMRKRFADLQ